MDLEGNLIGCTGRSIQNEEAVHIMCLVTKSLNYNKKKITDNLLAVIKPILALDAAGADHEKLKLQIKRIEEKRTNLIELFISGDITRDEFAAARVKCENEIAKLQSFIESIPKYSDKCFRGAFDQTDQQENMTEKQQKLIGEIAETISELVNGVEYEDDFYKEILDKMVINDKDPIDVYLNLMPHKWSYAVAIS